MGQPFVGEIRMFAGNFNPNGWAFCNGQLMPISENETLFALLGTIYGGDGQETFALPNLQGRLPVHQGNGPGQTFTIGETAGTETVTLTTQQIPNHNHPLLATNSGPSNPAVNAIPATAASPTQPGLQIYGAAAGGPTTLHPNTLALTGNNLPHNNMQPFLCINFIIALFGIFPQQS
jgi:microcystin-dependent protein